MVLFRHRSQIGYNKQVTHFTLNLQVEDNLVRPKAVTGRTSVVPRILCFDCADDKAAIVVDAAPTVNRNRGRGRIAEIQQSALYFNL